MNKEEIIAAIKGCAGNLGRVPKAAEVEVSCPAANIKAIRRKFGNYRLALEACGLEANGVGFAYTMRRLLEDWARLARELKRPPSMYEYEGQSQFSVNPLIRRFKSWLNVPLGMERFILSEGLEGEYADVLEMIKARQADATRAAERAVAAGTPARRPPLPNAGAIFGTPLTSTPLIVAPTNEAGVLVLFGMLAEKLGFIVIHVQTAFPDCLALLKLDESSCQMARLEMEYESRNFLEHGHLVKGCDMIVCWIHNWKECPLPVIELRPIVMEMMKESGDQVIR